MTTIQRRARQRAAPTHRALDVTLAGVTLLALSPLFLVCVIAVRATSRGPALFAQQRVGLGGRTFRMYKFRTMRHRCDDAVHRAYVTHMLTADSAAPSGDESNVHKLQQDQRVTRVGRYLRRTSLDELPQLINVIKGDMAIVGPRPALPYEVELFEPRHHVRFDVRPGITGLWQVSGRARLTMREALELDLAYVEQRRLALDLQIMARTVPAVFAKGGTS
jgi:lipopolysaccharide/colanic/teichoic acid biosynthesis glycosyltransferase